MSLERSATATRLSKEIWVFLRRHARRIAEARATPFVLGALAVLLILGGAGAALLKVRLAEMAEARALETPADLGAVTPPGLSSAELTLAPEAIRPISMDEARVWNAGLPFSSLPIVAAKPFIMPPDQLADYARALDCLTAAIYYEAASETGPGQAAVAQVVLNRMRHPAFPKTVCGVVFQGQERTTGCQFSFTCDGALARVPSAAGWARARAAAGAALNGSVAAEVGMATHYHTDWVAPYWAERLVKMRQIGTHIFYRWTGGWGLPGAFTGRHLGAEPVIEKLAALATYIETPPPELAEPTEVILIGSATGEDQMASAQPAPSLVVAPLIIAPADAEIVPPETTAVTGPPVLANPMASVTASAPQRRTRIAVPR